MFLNSSQFSQKENKKAEIESIYIKKDNKNEDSGEFIDFEKNSIVQT